MLGSCPNSLCGMQAIMFCSSLSETAASASVDFWWVKPSRASSTEVERETLNRHGQGAHKNDPGRSKQCYQLLANLFEQNTLTGGWRFAIEIVSTKLGETAPRAFMLQETAKRAVRLYVHIIWQEDWTTNPFARTKYIKGKIVYQKLLNAVQYFS